MHRHHVRRTTLTSCLFALAAAAPALPVLATPLNPLAYPSLGTLNLGAGSYTLDTGGALPRLLDGSATVLAVGVFQAQADSFNPWVAVFSFDSVQIGPGATVRASGSNPVALLSRSGIALDGTFDAAGRAGGPQGAGVGGVPGPGGGRGGNGGAGDGEPGQGPGGGLGGYACLGNCSYGEGGAYGGMGGDWNPALAQAPAYGDPAVVLQGGSGGGAGGRNLFGGGPGGGGGGGGVEFGALGFITVADRSLLSVAGGSFSDGIAVNSGGGSGGGLLLHAPTITLQTGFAVLDASGFSGGRITFLTDSGTVFGNTAGVSVGANFYGNVGVISYGLLAPVPEPRVALLLSAGLALLAWRRRSGA